MAEEPISPLARQLAAQCWCDEATQHIEMNPHLADAVARRFDLFLAGCEKANFILKSCSDGDSMNLSFQCYYIDWLDEFWNPVRQIDE